MNYFNQYDNGNWLVRLFAGLKEAAKACVTLIHQRAALPAVAAPASLYCPIVPLTLTAPYCKAPATLMIYLHWGMLLWKWMLRPHSMHCFPDEISGSALGSSAGRGSITAGGAVKQPSLQLVWTFCPRVGSRARYGPLFIIFILPPKDQFQERRRGKRMLAICCVLINVAASGRTQRDHHDPRPGAAGAVNLLLPKVSPQPIIVKFISRLLSFSEVIYAAAALVFLSPSFHYHF